MDRDEVLNQFINLQLQIAKLAMDAVNYALRNELTEDDKFQFDYKLDQTISVLNVAKDCIWAGWKK